MFIMKSWLNSSIESELYNKRYNNKICSHQLGFVFFRNSFLIDLFLDELNTANISFYEINIL